MTRRAWCGCGWARWSRRAWTTALPATISALPGRARQFHLSPSVGQRAGVRRACTGAIRRRNTRRACETLRRYMPDCAITTDVIIGFPGETEAEFAETRDVCGARRSLAHPCVSLFAARRNRWRTVWTDQVLDRCRRARAKKLIEIGNKMENEFVLIWLARFRRCCSLSAGGRGSCGRLYRSVCSRAREGGAQPNSQGAACASVGPLAMGESV